MSMCGDKAVSHLIISVHIYIYIYISVYSAGLCDYEINLSLCLLFGSDTLECTEFCSEW